MENRPELSTEIVLDSFALLAYLGDEKGKEKVEYFLSRALEINKPLKMAVINMGEVLYITERERGISESQLVLSRIKQLPIKLYDIDEELTLKTAHIKAGHPLAFSDCFAAGLAMISDSVLVTGDPEFKELKNMIEIYWI
jgi:predicted nucleic acid-binding protein